MKYDGKGRFFQCIGLYVIFDTLLVDLLGACEPHQKLAKKQDVVSSYPI